MDFFRRSKMDTFGVSMLVVGGTFFLAAATCFLVSLMIYATPGARLPYFSLLEIGVLAGGIGMLVIPLFVITMVINNIRERRRNSQTGKDIDEAHPERGAASGS